MSKNQTWNWYDKLCGLEAWLGVLGAHIVDWSLEIFFNQVSSFPFDLNEVLDMQFVLFEPSLF